MTNKATNDEVLSALQVVLNEKRADLERTDGRISASWKTNCSYQFGQSKPINITTAPFETVLTIASEVLMQKDYHQKAIQELGLSQQTPAAIDFDGWLHDCKKRIAFIERGEKKRLVDRLEQQINQLFSEDKRVEIAIASIQQELQTLG